jgi:hypothetical protein
MGVTVGSEGGGLLSGLIRRSFGIGNTRVPDLVSVLDPGTEYVKALVVQIESDRAVVIGEGMGRHSELPFERGTRAVDLRLKRACDEALRQAEDMTESVVDSKRVPDHAIMALPSHFVRQGAFTVQQKRNSPGHAVSAGELEHVLARSERLVVQQLTGQLGASKADVSLVGAEVMDIRVGGHSVSDPLGFYGDTLSVTLFNALVRNQDLAIMDRLAAHLELEMLSLVPGEYVLADSLVMEEAIIVNMGATVTSIGWTRGGCPMRMITLPWGGLNLTQRLASAFGLSQEKAEALKLKCSLGYLKNEMAETVHHVLWRGVVEWLARIEAGLATIAAKSSLPPYIYLCGGAVELPEVLEAVRSFPWLRHLSFLRYPEIHLLGPGQIPRAFNRTGRTWGCEMTTAMALARWAIPRQRRSDQVDEILRRVIRKTVNVYSGG